MVRAISKATVLWGLASALILVASSPKASVVLDTTPSWDGSNLLCCVGEVGAGEATMGQTFFVPTGTPVMKDFSFWIDYRNGPGQTRFAAYLMEWSASTHRAVGTPLYQSSEQTIASDGGIDDKNFVEYKFKTGRIALNPGQEYVAFLSSSQFYDGQDDSIMLGYLGKFDVIPGDSMVRITNGNDFSKLTTDSWLFSLGADLAFKARFNPMPMPTPPTLVLLATGLFGLFPFLKKQFADSAS